MNTNKLCFIDFVLFIIKSCLKLIKLNKLLNKNVIHLY